VSTRFLHVANGHCTTQLIERAGIPGALSIWADVLHEGPVPDLPDDALLEVRARHLAETPERVGEVIAGLREWRSAIDRRNSYDELILWYEHDLFDQLNLIQVLSRIGQGRRTGKAVSLVCIGSFPGRPRFKGLGELTPIELESLLPTRQPVSEAQYLLSAAAWRAFRSPDPRPIEALLRLDTSTMPFLAGALSRHLEEFPSTINGLSRTEQRLMELAEPGGIDVWAAFSHLHDQETAFYMGDTSFWHLVEELTATSPPLLALETTSSAPGRLPQGTISLTETGREVLHGLADRVARCGLQRWLGGVHLEGSEAMWRWHGAEARIVFV
jgi:hypothetical protein